VNSTPSYSRSLLRMLKAVAGTKGHCACWLNTKKGIDDGVPMIAYGAGSDGVPIDSDVFCDEFSQFDLSSGDPRNLPFAPL
jgi:hypothetical protein